LYEHGWIGVDKDFKEAMKWYLLSAYQGNAKAQFKVGYMYEHGDVYNTDLDLAVKWYLLSANSGYRDAKRKIKNIYKNGLYENREQEKSLYLHLKRNNELSTNFRLLRFKINEVEKGFKKKLIIFLKISLHILENKRNRIGFQSAFRIHIQQLLFRFNE